MSVEKALTYRGKIKAIAGAGGTLAFVTRHTEGRPTGLYRIDVDKLTLAIEPLPIGGTAIALEGETLWLSGSDGLLYQTKATSGPTKPLGQKLDSPALALVPVAENRLAALTESHLLVLSRKDGKVVQTVVLPEAGTCLAVDPTGRWLAVGMAKGMVAAYDSEGQPEFVQSASSKLHEGAVTAILFESDDLRFFSTGADFKLLSTHARGKLEPEDKGRGNNHSDVVTSLIWGPGDRLYSGSRDGSIKSWPRTGAVKPSTTRDGVARVVAMTLVTIHDRPRLVVACDDNTLRVFPIDPSGKIGDLSHRIHDAYALASQELSENDSARRELALKGLASSDDARSVELIAGQMAHDPDHGLRLMASQMLGASSHPKAPTLLEAGLNHNDEAVRVVSFQGLRRHWGESSLRAIDLALKVDRPDVGKLAVAALAPFASKDDRALSRLINALDAKPPEVRQAALITLESAYDAKSPEPNLLALESKYADVRRGALARLFARRLLEAPSVRSALRRRGEDLDQDVRRVAFLLGLQTRPRLLQALRARDPDLDRQLLELEGASPSKVEPRTAKGAKPAVIREILDASDLEPLLQATASRELDTCLRGAHALATLGDPRAFSLLLQLSLENAKEARAEVCRAMAALADPRSVERLRSMLHDKELEVRDAAFTALSRIFQAEPLLLAESGLNASHDDIHRRGLQVLVEAIRKAKEPMSEPARELLTRTLNDQFAPIRSEAFKAAISLKAGGDVPGTLRYAARSIHADVRREVLTEVMAQVAEPWGFDLLLESFNDPTPALREEAFAFALKKTKGVEFLGAALGSRYPDLRLKAVEALVKKHNAAAQALLARALDDEEKDVRLASLNALVDADALPALAPALENAHPDVRLRAAKALARHGDSRAFGPLLALATTLEPEEKTRQGDWLALAGSALNGLGELGDPEAVPSLIPILDSPHHSLRKEAARALARVSRPEAISALRDALQHADPEVKYQAVYGLACLGDASVASLLFSEAASKVIVADARIAASLTLGTQGEDRLIVALADPKVEVRSRALLLLMIREWKDSKGDASRCLAGLASRTARFRLLSARALEALASPNDFATFVLGLINDRGDKTPWKIDASTLDDLAELLVHASPQVQVRTALLLRHLDPESEDLAATFVLNAGAAPPPRTRDPEDQAAFDQAWKVHRNRFARELLEIRERAGRRKPLSLQYSPGQLQDLAFGAYVGLIRVQGVTKKKVNDSREIRVRQSALAHLLHLAEADPRHAPAATSVFVQALGDPNQAVRLQAFEQAQALGMPASSLADEALATGHVDLGVRGLELLTGEASEAEAQAVLERAMLSRKDDLAVEAARLLMPRQGQVPVATLALNAAQDSLRKLAVSWLTAEYDKDPLAAEPLRQALKSKHTAVREAAALELATKKDPAAFESLAAWLQSAVESQPQRRVITALTTLGDPRGVDALLDRVVNDPTGTALADELIQAVGRFRRPESADRLLTLMAKDPKRRDAAFSALVMVSGYNQAIVDPDDERVDDRWLAEQFPRHDDLLARLLDKLAGPPDARPLARLIAGARWAKGKAVDGPLGALISHPDDEIRRSVVEALGWRLRKRSGQVEPLRKALGHRDPTTQFLSAAALANAGHADGLNVLLASIDFETDLVLRRDAVSALGELGDERAFATLLKLATEEGHALQESAAIAIGHMGQSKHAEEVFKLLERMARGNDGLALAALQGLRWLNTAAAWQLIRDRAGDPKCPFRQVVVDLLGYHDDPSTRDFVIRLLGSLVNFDDSWTFQAAFTSARRLWGPDSLEPDYAAVQNDRLLMLDESDEIFERVRDRGEPSRVFAILAKCPDPEAIQGCLLDRDDLPVSEATLALESSDPTTASIAARVLGRAGHAAKAAGPAVEAALRRWRETWDKEVPAIEAQIEQSRRVHVGRYGLAVVGGSAGKVSACLRDLVWASGRLGVNAQGLAEVVEAHPEDPAYRLIRRQGVLALASNPATPEAVRGLESAATGGDPEVRSIASQSLATLDPARAKALAPRLMTDRVTFSRLSIDGKLDLDEIRKDGSRQVHSQGIVLADLVGHRDVATLTSVCQDRKLPEAARLGALEGLGAMALEAAETVLKVVGLDAKEEEEIRKAAWRALRRSQRSRLKPGPKPKAEVKA